MKKPFPTLLLVLVSLCLGVLIYTTSRTDALYLNQWASALGLGELKMGLRDIFPSMSVPSWIIYSLPDGLWMLALMLLVLVIWNFKINTNSLPWIAGAGMAGLLFEMGQSIHIVHGTFDVIDLVGVGIGAVLPVFIILLKPRLCDVN